MVTVLKDCYIERGRYANVLRVYNIKVHKIYLLRFNAHVMWEVLGPCMWEVLVYILYCCAHNHEVHRVFCTT